MPRPRPTSPAQSRVAAPIRARSVGVRHRLPFARMALAGLAVGLAVGLSVGAARADMVYWTGHTSSGAFFEDGQAPNSAFNYLPLVDLWTADLNGPLSRTVFKNLFIPTQPGGTSGTYVGTDRRTDITGASAFDLVFANGMNAARTVVMDGTVTSSSLQFTTRGDVHFVDPPDFPFDNNLVTSGWMVRWPGCTGDHSFDCDVFPVRMWLGGSGSMIFRARLSTNYSDGVLVKSGPGRMVIDPTTPAPSDLLWNAGSLAVRSGDVVLRGNGALPLYEKEILLGTEFGGQTAFPTDIPYPGWEVVDITTPPTPPAVAYVRQTNVATGGNNVRLGAAGSIVLDAPMSIDFGPRVISYAPGLGRITCAMPAGTVATLGPNSLANFTGPLDITSGTLRTPRLPTNASPVTFASSGGPAGAVLELALASGSVTYSGAYSGLGRILKTGAGTLTLATGAPAFTGDYRVEGGVLASPATAGTPAIAGDCTVSGPGATLWSRAGENIADDATVALDGGGLWDLRTGTETVAAVRMTGAASVVTGAASVALRTPLVTASPGTGGSALISGPGGVGGLAGGTLRLDVAASPAPVGLEISCRTLTPVLVTGSGVTRLSGPAPTAGETLGVRGGTVRLARTGAVSGAGPVSIGDATSQSAPTARVVLEADEQIPDGTVVVMDTRADLQLNGFHERVTGFIVTGPGPFTVSTDGGGFQGLLTLAGDSLFGSGATTFTGGIDLAGGVRAFQVFTAAPVTVTGRLRNGTLRKTGAGNLHLNALDGTAVIDVAAGTASVDDATIGGLTGTAPVRIDGSLLVLPPTSPAAGTAYGGQLTGAGRFVVAGNGRQELNGGLSNTHAGGTRVGGGTLFLNRIPGTTVIPGQLTVASGGTLLFAGGASNQIADAADVTVDAGGTVRMEGQTEVVRNIFLSGTWSVDAAAGAAGSLAATQAIAVTGGDLSGTLSGGALNLSVGGRARVRGTVASAAVGGAGTPAGPGSTLGVGGFPGSDVLTVSGALSITSTAAALEFTPGAPTDPAMLRVLGSVTYPGAAPATLRVNQTVPVPFGTVYRLMEFGPGAGTPQLARHTLALVPGAGSGVLSVQGQTLVYTVVRNPVPADADGSGAADLLDIFRFLTLWFAGDPGANFDRTSGTDLLDIFAFLEAWFAA